jgi:hypothetical protein
LRQPPQPGRLVRGAGRTGIEPQHRKHRIDHSCRLDRGVGAEAMLWSNWLTRIEYRYANYGTFGFTLFPGSGACGVGCDTITAEATLRTHTVLVGFAYKFGGPFIVR